MGGAAGGGLRAGGRVQQLHVQAAGAARAARAPAAAAAAAAAPQRHLPDVRVRARLLGVLLPQRRGLLHGGDLGQLHIQLRVPAGLRGPALRVQRLGSLVRADEPAADDGDGVHRGRRHGGRVPRHSSLLRRVGEASETRQGARGARGAEGSASAGPPAQTGAPARAVLGGLSMFILCPCTYRQITC